MNPVNTITSLEISKMLDESHEQTLNRIESNFIDDKLFIKSTCVENNKEIFCYNVTLKGCEIIANSLTIVKAVAFASMYGNKFYEMNNEDPLNKILETISNSLSSLYMVNKRLLIEIKKFNKNINEKKGR